MGLKAKRTEEKIAQVQAAALARHEARQQRAAERQTKLQDERAVRRLAREKAREQAGEAARSSGRPMAADEKIQLHAVTVRLNAEQYQRLHACTAPGGRKLAEVIRQVLAERRVFTTKEHEWLRRAPDLANATTLLAERLDAINPVAAAEVRALTDRIDAFLDGLHH